MECLSCIRPDKWFYNETKKEPRVFIYHHGPTNSGKSTSAVEELKKLDPQKKGIYMAPLRLLAWEYQQKLGNCTLITGQEKEYKHSNLTSCTIEAAPLQEEYEVAVID
jgi:ATP-dependent RNA helicase SUPV3L1/SUV3